MGSHALPESTFPFGFFLEAGLVRCNLTSTGIILRADVVLRASQTGHAGSVTWLHGKQVQSWLVMNLEITDVFFAYFDGGWHRAAGWGA